MLRADPALAMSVARTLTLSNFPETAAPDVLVALEQTPVLDIKPVLGEVEQR